MGIGIRTPMADGGISTVLRITTGITILVLRGIGVDLALCGYFDGELDGRRRCGGLEWLVDRGLVSMIWREKGVGCEFEV